MKIYVRFIPFFVFWSINKKKLLSFYFLYKKSTFCLKMTAFCDQKKKNGMNPTINLFVTSKNETTNSPIHQFMNLKCCIKAREPLKNPF